MREMRNAYKILVANPQRRRSFERCRHKLEDNINPFLLTV
jgi:hypothetical protein